MQMKSDINELNEQEIAWVRSCPNTLNDRVFKHVFGREEGKSSLIALLNAFLHEELGYTIKDLNYLNSESLGVVDFGKKIFFDIACTLDNGAVVNIEVQVLNNKNFAERITLYLARLLIGTLQKGKKYSDLKPAISLSILDFNLFQDDKETFSSFGICNLKNNKRLTKLISLNFVELRKFEKKEKLTTIDRWMMILSRQFSLREKREIAKGDVAMEQVLKDVDNYLMDFSNYVAYINQERYEMDENSKEDYLLGRGREEGEEKGRVEGRAEATAERNHDVALDMLKDGFQMNTIIKYSRLSLPEIKQIAQANGIII